MKYAYMLFSIALARKTGIYFALFMENAAFVYLMFTYNFRAKNLNQRFRAMRSLMSMT